MRRAMGFTESFAATYFKAITQIIHNPRTFNHESSLRRVAKRHFEVFKESSFPVYFRLLRLPAKLPRQVGIRDGSIQRSAMIIIVSQFPGWTVLPGSKSKLHKLNGKVPGILCHSLKTNGSCHLLLQSA